jgi:hypothetical protein
VVTRSGFGPAVVLALGLALPLVVVGGLALVTLTRSPMDSDRPPAPVIATVGRAERTEAQATTVTRIPAEVFPVSSQSTGTVTALHVTPGTPLGDGEVAMAVDGMPVIVYVAPAPLYRDLTEGMTGDDVLAAQEFLVRHGYLSRPERSVGRAAARAITSFNSDHGRGRTSTLPVGALLWVPEGSGPPREVTARIGDVVSSSTELYLTTDSVDQVVAATDVNESDRLLTVAGVEVLLPAGTTVVDHPDDVAALATAMGNETTAAAILEGTSPREVGTVPASAVVVDDLGRACFFSGTNGPAVRISAESGLFGLVDVDPRLIGSPVLTDPRRTGVAHACA